MKNLKILLVMFLITGGPAYAQSAQPPSGGRPPQIEGFVPVDTLPASEQLPAARLVIAAYGFVWIALLGYVWSLWRRLGRVEGELQQLAKRTRSDTR